VVTTHSPNHATRSMPEHTPDPIEYQSLFILPCEPYLPFSTTTLGFHTATVRLPPVCHSPPLVDLCRGDEEQPCHRGAVPLLRSRPGHPTLPLPMISRSGCLTPRLPRGAALLSRSRYWCLLLSISRSRVWPLQRARRQWRGGLGSGGHTDVSCN
jgi:hypothetical protein